jgi:hypothetical protein
MSFTAKLFSQPFSWPWRRILHDERQFFSEPRMPFAMINRQTKRTIMLIAPAAAALASVLVAAEPAAAQYYWGNGRYNGGYGGYRSYPSSPQRDFFYPFSGFGRSPPPVADSTKAPATRKLETPPATTVVVVGDSMADWLGYGLDELYADEPDIGVERKIRASSGLIRYDAKNETLDWPQAIKDALASQRPNAIIVMLGLNDRMSLRDKSPPQPAGKRPGEPAQGAASGQGAEAGQGAPAGQATQSGQGQGQGTNPAANQSAGQASQDKAAAPADTEAPPAAQNETQRPVPGGSYDFHTEQWATLYAKRVDQMIAALKSTGVPVIWVGLPAIRGPKSTGDMSYLDELYRARAEKAGIVYVDIWDGFVDDQGRYALQGPDFEGQIRRLRTADGVHFTKAGAVKLASYVDRDLRRVMSAHIAPLALPVPETAPNAPTIGTRPDVGPVLPLTVSTEGGDLVGAAGRATQTLSDPTAVKVLTRGDPLPAPSGRADDFSWPRPGVAAASTPDLPPQPAALAPAPPTKKAGEAKKPAGDSANDSKNKPGKESAPRKSSRPGNASLDGAPVPPAPIGSR